MEEIHVDLIFIPMPLLTLSWEFLGGRDFPVPGLLVHSLLLDCMISDWKWFFLGKDNNQAWLGPG